MMMISRNISGWGAKLLLLLVALTTAACGFRPLYGRTDLDPRVAPTLAAVYVDPIPDRVGYELRNSLLDLFNATCQADGAADRLNAALAGREEAGVLQSNTPIIRY